MSIIDNYPRLKARKIHAYAASFADELARELIISNTNEGDRCLDPFIGGATSLLHARLLSRSGIGIDIDPIACLISKVLTTSYSINEINGFCEAIISQVKSATLELSRKRFGEKDFIPGTQFSIGDLTAAVPNNERLVFWFSPVQRALLATLVAIANRYTKEHKDIVNLAISSSIIHKWPYTISLARDIDHSRPHKVARTENNIDYQVKIFFSAFNRVIRIINKLDKLNTDGNSEFNIFEGDSIEQLKLMVPNSIDYVITSPPYINAIDYPRAHKFSKWWLWPEKDDLTGQSYIGLKSAHNNKEYIEECKAIIPKHIDSLTALQRISMPDYLKVCRYVAEINDIIKGIRPVLKRYGKLSFILANNNIKGLELPIVDITCELLQKNGFHSVGYERRVISNHRRRYPFGIKGFKGLMESEFIINAINTRRHPDNRVKY